MPTHTEVRTQLALRQQQLESRLTRIRDDLHHRQAPRAADFAEQVTEGENDAVLLRLSESTAAELAQLGRAIAHFDEGLYGTCSRCGRPISAERLQAVPEATECVACVAHPGVD